MNYSADIECTLIGDIFHKSEIMNECVQYLTPDSFGDTRCRRVYRECYLLYSRGEPIDPLTVVNRMGKEKDDYKVFILDCYKSVISVSGYRHHIMLVRENAIRRAIKADCYAIASDGSDGCSLDEIEDRLSRLLNLFNKNGKDDAFTVSELHKGLLDYLQGDEKYIKSGIRTLDNNLLISKGDYIIVGGRPSSGKTALTAQFAVNMSKKCRVVYFSLETSPLKLWLRMVANGAGMKLRDLKTKAIMTDSYPNRNEAWQKINEFTVNTTENSSLTIISAAGYTVSQIKSKALQLNADVIFVDYLTLIKDGGNSAYERATKISTDLHTLAQSEGITVFALAQLNRQSENENKKPAMSDLRESGQLEQDADAILLLSGKTDNDTGMYAARTLYLAKNKEGETGEIDLIFRGDYQRFEEKT